MSLAVGIGLIVSTAIEWRYATLAIAVGLILVSVALVEAGYLRYQFFPPVVGNTARANLVMPPGSSREVTDRLCSSRVT